MSHAYHQRLAGTKGQRDAITRLFAAIIWSIPKQDAFNILFPATLPKVWEPVKIQFFHPGGGKSLFTVGRVFDRREPELEQVFDTLQQWIDDDDFAGRIRDGLEIRVVLIGGAK